MGCKPNPTKIHKTIFDPEVSKHAYLTTNI